MGRRDGREDVSAARIRSEGQPRLSVFSRPLWWRFHLSFARTKLDQCRISAAPAGLHLLILIKERRRMDFVSILSIFVLACFVGYFVVWSVTPALHTPLMSVTNAISSVIIVGALIASAAAGVPGAKWLGLAAVAMASVNIFGGFAVTARMLAMYKKRER